MRIADLLTRLKARWTVTAVADRRWISELLALMLAAASLLAGGPRKLALLVNAARRSDGPLSRTLLRPLLRARLEDPARRNEWREHRVGWGRYYGGVADIARDRALTTSLVLKEPGPDGEKGVLYSSFEFNWMRIVANHDARALLRDYLLVGASSWSPGDHAVLATLQGLSDDPVFVGISNRSDIKHYGLWTPGGGTVPLPITAADWVDPAMYRPRPHGQRGADIVMVSHFAKWKRHWLLFDALRRMPATLRVVLIGRAADGRTEQNVLDEARAFGVRQHIDVYRNLEIDEVAAYQADARVAVALSRREGSCVSVTEAMLADTPIVMMDDAHVGTRAYINEHTGRIASRRTLAAALMHAIGNPGDYAPRRWALGNVAADVTSKRLNAILRDHCVARGMPWTRDIVPMCWRYVPQYLDPADDARMQTAVYRLRARHGVVLERFAGERVTAGRHAREPRKTPALQGTAR